MLDDSEVKPSEVQFLEKLKEGKNSVVFKVSFRKMTCVMKVVRICACIPMLSTSTYNWEVS